MCGVEKCGRDERTVVSSFNQYIQLYQCHTSLSSHTIQPSSCLVLGGQESRGKTDVSCFDYVLMSAYTHFQSHDDTQQASAMTFIGCVMMRRGCIDVMRIQILVPVIYTLC